MNSFVVVSDLYLSIIIVAFEAKRVESEYQK